MHLPSSRDGDSNAERDCPATVTTCGHPESQPEKMTEFCGFPVLTFGRRSQYGSKRDRQNAKTDPGGAAFTASLGATAGSCRQLAELSPVNSSGLSEDCQRVRRIADQPQHHLASSSSTAGNPNRIRVLSDMTPAAVALCRRAVLDDAVMAALIDRVEQGLLRRGIVR